VILPERELDVRFLRPTSLGDGESSSARARADREKTVSDPPTAATNERRVIGIRILFAG